MGLAEWMAAGIAATFVGVVGYLVWPGLEAWISAHRRDWPLVEL